MGFCFPFSISPPMKREMESSDTPISTPLHWWFSPANENYSQNIPHECWGSWWLAAKRERLTVRTGAELFVYNSERELHKYMNLGLHALRYFILTSRTHKESGTSLVVQGLRLCSPCTGPGFDPGQGTRSHMLQQKTRMPQQRSKTPCAQQTLHSQIDK